MQILESDENGLTSPVNEEILLESCFKKKYRQTRHDVRIAPDLNWIQFSTGRDDRILLKKN